MSQYLPIALSLLVNLAVLAAGYWLVKPPPATTESTMPFAARPTTTAGESEATSDDTDTNSATATNTSLSPGNDQPTGDTVVVYVTGAVDQAGVYSLPTHSRVVDAVDAAGGVSADAQVDAVNLAAVVTDGQRVYVPRQGDPVPVGGGAGMSGRAPVDEGPIDLNAASEEQLDALPGVGPATAAAIVAYRDEHGPFGSVDDLGKVHGIGPAKLDALRDLVTV